MVQSNVYLKNLPVGAPGRINRYSGLADLVEPNTLSLTNPPLLYGVPVKMGADGKIQPIGAGDVAASVIGVLTAPFPAQSMTYTTGQDFGGAVPPAGKQAGILRRGYITAALNGATDAVKNGPVFVRIANGSANQPVGGFEAAADGANTIQMPASWYYRGPRDANLITEVAVNI